MTLAATENPIGLRLVRRFAGVSWFLLALVIVAAALGLLMLYSAAGGSYRPWATGHAIRFGIGCVAFLMIAMVDVRFIYRMAYPLYALTLLLVVFVAYGGATGMGARRWIALDLGPYRLQIQPSEFMKFAVILALARYYHECGMEQIRHWSSLIIPTFLISVPAFLIRSQPDLGTCIMILTCGVLLMFLAGTRKRWFLLLFVTVLAAAPVVWTEGLDTYQQERIRVFLDPGLEPLGAGYHITQSKIAMGSGGVWGKGFLSGSQSQLDFLPEKQTDFIFTMFAEEFGMTGAVGVLLLYFLIVSSCLFVALRSGNQFGRLVASGTGLVLFLYVTVNVGMVTGLLPVVGVPLPLLSYGGSSMLALMMALGAVSSVNGQRDIEIPRSRAGFL